MGHYFIKMILSSRNCLWLVAIIQVLCLVALPEVALAKGDCFCLRDAAENLLVGCKKDAKDITKTICFDQGKNYWVVVNTTGWTEIPEGKPGCKQCATQKKDPPSVIHGGNGEEE